MQLRSKQAPQKKPSGSLAVPVYELELIPPNLQSFLHVHRVCANRAKLRILRSYREPGSNLSRLPKT
jgi:hypothetical protein